MSRRLVRVSGDFFDQLDRQLPAERGPNGEPSASDFVGIDLPVVIERFASGFDELPEAVPGVSTARVIVGTGKVVEFFVVYGLLLDDDAIELIGVDIDS